MRLSEQHQLGFKKALKQVAYFYKTPLDEGKFDVGKDFYQGKLILVTYFPTEESGNKNTDGRK